MCPLQIDHDQALLTRPQRRQQARATRLALEQARVERDLRRRRIRWLGTVVAGVVSAVVAVLIATGQSTPAAKVTPQSAQGQAHRASEASLKRYRTGEP
jgi:hypothetical protein